ncbi:MAG: hypothetical protein IPM77_08340 [Crocinitomicaceae bacterium]|nr:hypothetical protein [Crocinitomicaceae bacterium]
MSFQVLVVLFFSGIFLQSCNGNSDSAEQKKDTTVVVNRDTVLASWNFMRGGSAVPNTVIILEGFIGNPGDKIVQNGSYITLPVYERSKQQSGYAWLVQFKVGDMPNQMRSLPEQFTPNDIQIKCDNGGLATIGSRIKITAFDENQDGQTIWKARVIEYIDFISSDEKTDSAQNLTSEILFDSTQKEVYSFVEGKLELPLLILPYTSAIKLNLTESSVAEIKEVEVPLGTGPSSMNDLPDNFTEKNLVIRDRNGNLIPYKSKVRIYGNWVRFDYSSSFPGKFYLEEIELR